MLKIYEKKKIIKINPYVKQINIATRLKRLKIR